MATIRIVMSNEPLPEEITSHEEVCQKYELMGFEVTTETESGESTQPRPKKT